MNKIEFFYSIHTPEETNTMGTQLVLTIQTSGSTDEKLLKGKDALQTANLKLTNVLNSVKSNPFTQKQSEADAFRKSTYKGGRDVIDGMTNWVFDPEKQDAATRLKEILVRHGWDLYRYNNADKISATNSLIEELKKEENQKDIALIGLGAWFNALVQSEHDYEKVFNDKSSYDSNKESAVKREAQIPVSEAIDKLGIYINSVILFSEEDANWTKIYNDVDGIIKQATTRARTRRSNGGDKTTEE